MIRDLTVGKPEKVLASFCIPLFASVVFQQIYNIADSLVAGKFIGENALAAVGNSYEITLIYLAFSFGCNMGCSVISSQLYGAGKLRELKSAVSTSILLAGAICLVLMLGGGLGGRWILQLISTPSEIFADSELYLRIYTLGLPFLFYYNIANGIFAALGDSATPFRFLAVSSVANIFVDILFVAGFGMGVSGVAWATFLCQGVSCILSMWVVMRRVSSLKCEGKAERFSVSLLKKILLIMIPSTLQQSFVSVGNIFIQSFINGFGPGVIAGYAASIKLNNLVITSLTTLGNGITNFTAQNIGAGKDDRVRKGFTAGIRLVWMICVPVVILYLLLTRPLILLFMKKPTDLAMTSALRFLRIVVPFYFVVSAKLASDGILRGAGLMKQFMTGTLTDLVIRVLLAFFFSKIWGYTGIWMAWPLGWIVSTLISLYFSRKSMKAGFKAIA